MVGLAGEGRLRDASTASAEFRGFLKIVPISLLMRYAIECLGDEKFADGGKALQDIINEVGRRLGFEVENGLYQGRKDQIGFDGLWRGEGGYSIIVEVKTTDTYSIDLDTLSEYREKLAKDGKINLVNSSILIVVGRADTGSWEAQVRGSRQAWDIRLISVQALMRLMQVKHELDDPAVIQKVQSVLRPREFTKLDEIVELVFQAAADVKQEKEIDDLDDGEDDESKSIKVEKKPKFTPVNFRDACALRLSKQWDVPLVRRSFAFYSTADESLGVVCLNSRQHMRGNTPSFWFALHPHQVENMKKHGKSWLALGCGDVDRLIVIPLAVLEEWLPKMWTTTKEERTYWHVVVIGTDSPKLRLSKPEIPVDLTSFVLKK